MKRIRMPSPAMVVAMIALFVALGGTGYAVKFKPARNSVSSKSLRTNAVTTKKIKNRNVTRSKIAKAAVGSVETGKDAIEGKNILEASLGKVPDADRLDGHDSSEFIQGTRIATFTIGSGETKPIYQKGIVTLTAKCSRTASDDAVVLASVSSGSAAINGTPSDFTPGSPESARTVVSVTAPLGGKAQNSSDNAVVASDGTEFSAVLHAGTNNNGQDGRCAFGGFIV